MSIIRIQLDQRQLDQLLAATNRLSAAIEQLVEPPDDLTGLTSELKTHQEGLSHAIEAAAVPPDQPQP